MLKSFFKCLVIKKSIYLDSWIILLSSFVLSFIMVFTFSMALSLIKINRMLVYPDILIDGSLDDDELKSLDNLIQSGGIKECSLVANLYGILETREKFEFVNLKEVQRDYFTDEKIGILNIDRKILDSEGLMISSFLANKLNVGLGDKVAFVDSITTRAVMYKIIGIYESGLQTFDKSSVFFLNPEKLRNKRSMDKIYQSSRKYELVFNSNTSIKLFGRSIYDNHDSPVLERIYESPLSDKVYSPHYSLYQIINSLNSVRFIAFLFILLSVCYIFAFIRNFKHRSQDVIEIYKILGCDKIWFLESLALVSVAVVSALTGIILGSVSCVLFRNFLILLNDWKILSLDYYVLKFRIIFPIREFLIYICIICTILIFVRLLHLLKIFIVNLVQGIFKKHPYMENS